MEEAGLSIGLLGRSRATARLHGESRQASRHWMFAGGSTGWTIEFQGNVITHCFQIFLDGRQFGTAKSNG
jgi:hypothetical protein